MDASADDETPDAFPGVDGNALRRPPTRHQPRTRTLDDGTEVNWCSECGYWGDHLRAHHSASNAVVAESGNLAGSVDGDDVGAGIGATDGSTTYVANLDVSEEPTGTFARLRLAGLM